MLNTFVVYLDFKLNDDGATVSVAIHPVGGSTPYQIPDQARIPVVLSAYSDSEAYALYCSVEDVSDFLEQADENETLEIILPTFATTQE